uniref:Uncharacterized protein n=1 Tax=Micrurus paraensis TaxID=1970185 RepID=A0A2D4KXG8_9SAUR
MYSETKKARSLESLIPWPKPTQIKVDLHQLAYSSITIVIVLLWFKFSHSCGQATTLRTTLKMSINKLRKCSVLPSPFVFQFNNNCHCFRSKYKPKTHETCWISRQSTELIFFLLRK